MKRPYVYGVYVSLMEGIHVSVREKAIGEEGKENEFREGQKLVT